MVPGCRAVMKILGQHSIRAIILIPLSVTIAVLMSAFLYSAYRISTEQNIKDMRHRDETTQLFLQELLRRQGALMKGVLEKLVFDPELKLAMLEKDRAALYKLSQPLYQQLRQHHAISHFYFHDPAGNTFLRVYDPTKFGDPVERHVFKAAAKARTVTAGLEKGRLGTISYRSVMPWLEQGELIGYIEIGVELDFVLEKLKEIVKDDFLATINKQQIRQEDWLQGKRVFSRAADWSIFPDDAIAASTLPSDLIPSDIARGLERPVVRGEILPQEFSSLHFANRTYRYKWSPLRDLAGHAIGKLIVLHDSTVELADFRRFIAQVLLLSGVLTTGMFIFAYTLLGQIERQLMGTRQRLAAEVDKVRTMNHSLKDEIAQRHRAEQDLKQLNDSLEARVEQRTMALRELNQELETSRAALDQAYQDLQSKHSTILHQEKMACIGQLAAGVAHDINNPMGFISNNLNELNGYADALCRFIVFLEALLREKCDSGEVNASVAAMRSQLEIDTIMEDVGTLIEESLEGSERVSEIVKNLRNFSRIDDQEYSLADINKCLESTINIVWNELKYKAKVIRDYGDIPEMPCYPGQLNQVFMNLLVNAAQAIDRYGTITVRTWVAGPETLGISISDTGSGIAAEHRSRIFEPFFTTKEVGKGTGLGLSITYDIIRQHNGDITVESELGSGTTFTIMLPMTGKMPEGAGREDGTA